MKKAKAHEGQAKSAARKRRRQIENRLRQQARPLQQNLRRRNLAQDLQDQFPAQISIMGFDNWHEALPATVNIRKESHKYFGGATVDFMTYLRVDSDLGQVSFERSVLSELLTMGYQLEELEIQFSDKERSTWGRCRWLKTHPTYDTPDEIFRKSFPKATPAERAFIFSMFDTEHAGEKMFGLLSTQMIGAALFGLRSQILLHKTLIFRKAVLSAPAQSVRLAA